MNLISIIIPVYNVENYLVEALNSIINQTYQNLEIIIVNDGSTDNGMNIISEFQLKDSRIKVINQKNMGLSEARNSGLKIARGKYVYFFDSDDILENKAMELCIKKAEKNNLDLVLFDASSFEDVSLKKIELNKYILGKKVLENKIYDGKEFLSKELFLSPVWIKFIKLDILKLNSLDFYRGILHEDELFTPLLYIHCEKVGYINEVFFNRRVREGSIMQVKKTEKNIISSLIIAKELKKIECDLESKNKINQRIRGRISYIIDASIKVDLREKYFCILKEEFKSYLSFKNKAKMFSPKIYDTLKKIIKYK